ncbi:MAG: hypothetical protein H6934_03500 [Burkholderiaceae bacterium]|nr:hypothetical protein [Burkholderiaceae bacterium]
MKKRLPRLRTDTQAERFVAEADLTEFDLGDMKPMRFEFARKEARVNMRLPDALLTAVKSAADDAGIPYQRFIRQVLEEAVSRRNATGTSTRRRVTPSGAS